VLLQDLTFMEDGNPDFIDIFPDPEEDQPAGQRVSESNSLMQLVNFEKRQLLSKVLVLVQDLQNASNYPFYPVSVIQAKLVDPGHAMTEKDAYELSLKHEPRETP
jgi:hypothetical protein